ncbi:MAG: VOC family protein [Verrucomicrobiae bacterium]|nr:VOC family protein [Verrucomicrobiae bacterium]
MLKVTEIAFRGYAVTHITRARKFYQTVLGLEPTMTVGEHGGMQWTEYDNANGTLSIGAGAPDRMPSGWAVVLYLFDLR